MKLAVLEAGHWAPLKKNERISFFIDPKERDRFLEWSKPIIKESSECLDSYISADRVDDSNQFAAYRLRFGGKASYIWAIYYQGRPWGSIARHDSKWVHDNWGHKFGADNIKALAEAGIITKENRAHWDKLLKDLEYTIRRALKERRAEVVVLPVKPTDGDQNDTR